MNKSILACLVLILFSCNQRQTSISEEDLSKALNSIRLINKVEYEHVGITGEQSDNYKNFLILKKAGISTLLRLTEDSNAVVACYAGWALIDKSYPDLPGVFTKFLANDKVVTGYSGCSQMPSLLSSEFYHWYWNGVKESKRPNDRNLFFLDSLILYNSSDWLLTKRALENRVYPASFNKQIEYLAFNETNWDAIFYLIKWKRDQYQNEIKSALQRYLVETDFINVGVSYYFETIDELLKFNDEETKSLIVRKLKRDTHWKSKERKFLSLLQKYGIPEKNII